MSNTFDPYREWLGVDTGAGEPTYYQLLGVSPSDHDATSVSHAADRAMNRVRSVRPGEHAAQWAELLDTLKTAKACLLDPTQRAAYDQQLASRPAAQPSAAASPQFSGRPAPANPNMYPPTASGGADPMAPVAQASVPSAPIPSAPTPVAPIPAAPANSNSLPPSAPAPSANGGNGVPLGGAPVFGGGASASGPAADPMAPVNPQGPSAYSAPASPAYPRASSPAVPVAGTMGGPSYQPHAASPAPGYGGATPQPVRPASPAQAPSAHPAANDPMAPVSQPTGSAGGYPNAGPSVWPAHQPNAAPAYNAAPQAYHGSPQAVPMQAAYGYDATNQGHGAPAAGGYAPAYGAPQATGHLVQPHPTEPTPRVRGAKKSAAMAAMDRARRGRQAVAIVALGFTFILLMGGAVVYALGGFDGVLGHGPKNVAQNPNNTRTRAQQPPIRRPAPTPAVPDQPVPATNPATTPAAPSTPTSPSTNPWPDDPAPTTTDSTPTTPSPADPTMIGPRTTDPSTTNPGTPDPGVTPPATPTTPVPAPTDPTPTNPDTNPSPTTPDPANPDPAMPAKPPTSGESGLLGDVDPSFLPDTQGPLVTPPKPPTDEELKQLGLHLTAARTALSDIRITDAEKSLAKADALPQRPAHAAKLERLHRMSDYLQSFRNAVAAGLETLAAGSTLQVGTSTEVGIVEAKPDYLIVRVAGTNKRFAVDEMPIGLAVAVANKVMPDNAESKVIKGAYVLINSKSTEDFRATARGWWEEAQQAGALDDMMLFLDDTYDFSAKP